ncbi:hypothetical protein, partial [Nodularia chucula]|uniref:hypothetical protein n=1 Tax=Nodularia chucula TaxID=3093667 RepID=UPI0039C63A48
LTKLYNVSHFARISAATLDNHRPTTVFKQQANQQDTQQVQNLDDSSQQRLEQKTEAIACPHISPAPCSKYQLILVQKQLADYTCSWSSCCNHKQVLSFNDRMQVVAPGNDKLDLMV